MKIDKTTGEKVNHPHEPGTWFSFRPLTWGESKAINRLPEEERPDAMLQAGIVAWSYDYPVSKEALNDQDALTLVWAMEEIAKRLRRPETEGEALRPA